MRIAVKSARRLRFQVRQASGALRPGVPGRWLLCVALLSAGRRRRHRPRMAVVVPCALVAIPVTHRAAQHGAVGHRSVAASVFRAYSGCSSVDTPLLRHHLPLGSDSFARDADPRSLDYLGAPSEQAGSRANERVVTESVDLCPTAVCRSASAVADRERHAIYKRAFGCAESRDAHGGIAHRQAADGSSKSPETTVLRSDQAVPERAQSRELTRSQGPARKSVPAARRGKSLGTLRASVVRPPAHVTGPTMVASTACCEPCRRDSPFATTSTRRSSETGTSMCMSAKRTLRATRAPASWHTLATARSRGRSCTFDRSNLWLENGRPPPRCQLTPMLAGSRRAMCFGHTGCYASGCACSLSWLGLPVVGAQRTITALLLESPVSAMSPRTHPSCTTSWHFFFQPTFRVIHARSQCTCELRHCRGTAAPQRAGRQLGTGGHASCRTSCREAVPARQA